MTTRKIRLENAFHNTSMNIVLDSEIVDYCLDQHACLWFEISLRAEDDRNLRAKFNKINRTLCGSSGCCCDTISSWKVIS